MKHLGEAIKEELNGQERSVTWFARQLSCDRFQCLPNFPKREH